MRPGPGPVDYSPLAVGVIGAVQLAATVAGASWGVVVAVRNVQPVGRSAPEAGTALRVLWVVGVRLAVAAAVAVAVLSADLERRAAPGARRQTATTRRLGPPVE